MDIFVFSIIGWLVIASFVMFLPLDLSKRGKLIINMTILVCGELGLLMTKVFSLWQSLAILVLFIGLISYFLLTRLDSKLFHEDNVFMKVTKEEALVEEESEVLSVVPFDMSVSTSHVMEEKKEIDGDALFPIQFDDTPHIEPIFLEETQSSKKEEETIETIDTFEDLEIYRELETTRGK